TSTGLEKKNGGSQTRPKTGTLARYCQSAIATTATRICRQRSVRRDIANPSRFRDGAGLGVTLQHLFLQNTPNLAVERVELLLHADLEDVARSRQPHFPVANDA